MLVIRGLNQFYGESHTLWDFDLQVPVGECTVIMGRNGVGKTTLLQCIMGLAPIASGSMTYADIDIARLVTEQRAQIGLGYVPQGRLIFPLLTVEENLRVALNARNDGVDEIPDYIFDLFPVLNDMRGRRGGDLSGGQQQQLAIGRALATDPKLLILDEPTEGIQPNVVNDIGNIVTRLISEFRLTVLLVEQKLPFARRVGDRFCIIDRGRKVAEDTMRSLDDKLIRQYLTV